MHVVIAGVLCADGGSVAILGIPMEEAAVANDPGVPPWIELGVVAALSHSLVSVE